MVTFPPKNQQQCTNFTIINDEHAEPEERFTVHINSATPPGVDTSSGKTTTTVIIKSDDCKLYYNLPTINFVIFAKKLDSRQF